MATIDGTEEYNLPVVFDAYDTTTYPKDGSTVVLRAGKIARVRWGYYPGQINVVTEDFHSIMLRTGDTWEYYRGE